MMNRIVVSLLLFCFTHCARGEEVKLPSSLKPEPHQRDPYIWEDRHRNILERHKTVKPDYVVIGDSITHKWGGEPVDEFGQQATESWNDVFEGHVVTNMGFGFDYIDNAYYRVREGELDHISPRIIILLIGTNNAGHRKDPPDAIAANKKAFIHLLKEKCPDATILLLGLLPRREEDLVTVIKTTNRMLEKLADGKKVIFRNPGAALKEENTDYPRHKYMSDTVHLNRMGYEKLAFELKKILKEIDPKYRH